MIHDLRPYPAYKDSGVLWLGEVPEHWEVIRCGRLLREIVDTGHPNAELLSIDRFRGIIRQSETGRKERASEDRSSYKKVLPGELAYNLMNAFMGSIGFSTLEGIISPAYAVARPLREIEPAYFHNLFRTQLFTTQFDRYSYGIMYERNRLYFERFKTIPTIIPSISEQSAIVHYLDYIDRRIRRYIRAKQKLIKLLEEQKQAIIHQAVTRGLDPKVKLKPSGVEWLGEIPEHWEVRRVKQISQILRGKFTHRPRNDPAFYDGPYPFIQTGEVARAVKVITSFRQTLNERGLAISKMFPRGTLVMTIAANIGDVAVLDFEACFPDSVVGFVPRNFVERDFLYYVFCAMKPELLCEAPVNTQGNLNVDRIGSRAIGLPPLTEQREIVRLVEESTADLEKVIAVARNEISLLLEYRTRLIVGVVTGKLDVRDVAANLPEETDETEVIEVELAGDEDITEEDLNGEP